MKTIPVSLLQKNLVSNTPGSKSSDQPKDYKKTQEMKAPNNKQQIEKEGSEVHAGNSAKVTRATLDSRQSSIETRTTRSRAANKQPGNDLPQSQPSQNSTKSGTEPVMKKVVKSND